MKAVVQARLDAESAKLLKDVTTRLGWTPSRAVREGIRLLAVSQAKTPRRRIVGIGKYSSGVGDLATNKKHLEGFGR